MKKVSSRTVLYVFIVLIFFVGALVLFYPAISSHWAKEHQLKVIDNYNEAVDAMDASEIADEMAKAVAYNKGLLNGNIAISDPFGSDSTDSGDDEYNSVLAVTEAMAYIEIPAINVYLPIYHGTDEDTLAEGVGHLKGSSVPVGGTGTHCVLSAHSGLPSATLFTNLEKLKVGDIFYIHVLDQVNVYQVDQINVVLPTDTSLLQIDPAQDYVTLVTCTPYGVNTHRLLVRGTRIYPTKAEQQALTDTDNAAKSLTTVEIVQYLAFILAAILFLSVLIFFIVTRRKKRETEGEDNDKA